VPGLKPVIVHVTQFSLLLADFEGRRMRKLCENFHIIQFRLHEANLNLISFLSPAPTVYEIL
jgi:hypothetical protein